MTTPQSDSQSTLLSDFCEDCSICYSSENNGKVVKLPCSHSYHLPCLTRYLESSNDSVCCVCRHVIFPEVLVLLQRFTESIGMENEDMRVLQEEVVQIRSDVSNNNRRIDGLLQRTDERFKSLEETTIEELKNTLEQFKGNVNVMEQQIMGLRHQIRVLEDVLSVRVNQNTSILEGQRITRSRSNTGTSQQHATTSSVSVPSSVRRTGARSVMMRKWQRFRTQRATFYSNRHPELTRGAIQEMVRNEWNRMSQEEKQAIQL